MLHGYPDWDQDGCTDADELWQNKPNATTKCGDDPWNPYDVTPPSTDVSGSYDITAIAIRQDVGAPGFYYDCRSDFQQSGKNLTVRLYCYIDAPFIVVNPEAVPAPNAGAVTCPPAPAGYCGDGISGAPPPGTTVGTYNGTAAGPPRLFGKIGAKHVELKGVYDKAQNAIKLNGCFQSNIHNIPVGKVGLKHTFLGDVWVDAIINAHTGHGLVKIWAEAAFPQGQGAPPCPKPMVYPALGSPPPGMDTNAMNQGGIIPVHIVRQSPPKPTQALANITCAGSINTYTTVLPHGLATGNQVLIAGAAPAGFNGKKLITVTGPNAFTSVKNNPPGCPAAQALPPGTWASQRIGAGGRCSIKKKLGDIPAMGGLRDPYNSYDYFNPTQDGLIRVDDILAVVNQYFLDDPPNNPDLKSPTDRTAIPGDNPWNLGPPNGQQRVDDILAAVKQYFHDC